MKKMLSAAIAASMLLTCAGTLSLSANADSIFTLSCDTKKLCVDYSAEEENKNVFFTSEYSEEVSGITLFDADTDEKIAVLYDDGKIAESGDAYINDGEYSGYFNMEEKSVGTYCFYAQYTDAHGEIHTSNTVEIAVYRLFTQQELDDMNRVDNAIKQLMESDEFTAIDDAQQRVDAVAELLYALAEEGIVNADSITICADSQYNVEFSYACGVQGVVDMVPFNENTDGGEVTTTAESTVAAETTTTTVTTEETTMNYDIHLKLNGYSRNAEFMLDEEDRDVIFTATCIKFKGDQVELIDAETDEVVAVMLDDGDFGESGDDLENDGTWSVRLNFDEKDAGEYGFYVRMTDADGNVSESELLYVVVYDSTTSDILKDRELQMQIAALKDDEVFQAASLEGRKAMTEELLNTLIEEGYINKGSVKYVQDGLVSWVYTRSGITAYFDFYPYDPDIVGGGTTTTVTTKTTTTETTVTTSETLEETGTTTTTDNTTATTETNPTTTTTTEETTLPQTGYSKWYHVAAALAACMTGIGGAMLIGSGVLKKKREIN